MQIRRYEADTIQEALRMVKEDLGPEALILSTRRRDRSGKGMLSKGEPVVEVTAALDPDLGRSARDSGMDHGHAPVYERIDRLVSPLRTELQQIRAALSGLKDSTRCSIGCRCDDIGYLLHHGVLRLVPPLAGLYTRLVENDVKPRHALGLLSSIGANEEGLKGFRPQRAREMLLKKIRSVVRVSGPILLEPQATKAVALMGPTGVGKTTTIAKLAAHYALKEKKKVALITMDTYRIAAVQQLKVYAGILGLPMKVVLSPEQLDSALRQYRSKELVLIDTAGRSPMDTRKIEELGRLLRGSLPLEVHLLISAGTKISDQDEIAERFGTVGFDRIIFTKLDESRSYGGILNQVIQTKKPISYLTVGQRVPEDIEAASAERIGEMILGSVRERAA